EPQAGLLEGSGAELGNGVVVDQRFETGVPGVFAVGDVANFYDPVFGRQRGIEHWSNSNYPGTEVGKILAGAAGGYDVVSTFFTEVFGVSLRVLGDTSTSDELVFRGSIEDGTTIGFCLERGRLVAAIVMGQDEATETRLKELIRERAELPDRSL